MSTRRARSVLIVALLVSSCDQLGLGEAPAPKAPLKAGESVFNFTALAHNGQRLRLAEFLQRPVLVYFCAADRDPTCQRLALSLRDQWLNLNPSLSMAFGVTAEDTVVHRDFAAEHALPHLLIADSDNSVRRVFGIAPGATTGFLISPERKVLHAFSTPNVASFGLTEAQAKEAGHDVVVGKLQYGAVGAGTVYGDRTGLVKVVGDKKYGELLGGHIIGAKATELIQELVNVRALEGGYPEAARIVHGHPTLSEAVMEAARAADGWLIHG